MEMACMPCHRSNRKCVVLEKQSFISKSGGARAARNKGKSEEIRRLRGEAISNASTEFQGSLLSIFQSMNIKFEKDHGMSKKSIVLAICLSAAVSAFAQFTPDKRPVGAPEAVAPKPAVEVKLVQKKVVLGDKGVEQLADADSARPDDVIEYQATYTNRSDKAVSQVVANLPLPEGLEYVPKSARPAQGVKLSAQDRQFGTEPLSRKSMTGKTEPVPYNEYRAVRWTIGQIPAGKSVTVSARAKVEAVQQLKAPPTSASEEGRAAVATKP
jgi:uncharacterized repeat protein (TIGR01451 family)